MSTSARWSAISKMTKPAMSPTMSEGNLVEWKVKEGESFSAGSVILDIVRGKPSAAALTGRKRTRR